MTETEITPKVAFYLKATPGRIIVKEDEFSYKGRIIIPDKTQRRPTTGTVIDVGEGVGKFEYDNGEPGEWIPLFSRGDRLVYGVYSGTVLNFKGQPAYRVLGQDEILAVMHGEAELEGVGV
jgi:co-chaperonin GroES (HSP10)